MPRDAEGCELPWWIPTHAACEPSASAWVWGASSSERASGRRAAGVLAVARGVALGAHGAARVRRRHTA
jgi:hypothetical protein